MPFRDIQKFVRDNCPKELETVQKSLPYKIPRSHPSWDLLSCFLTYMMLRDEDNKSLYPLIDRATYLHNFLWIQWYKNRFPSYCISKELLEQFLATDASKLDKIVPPSWVPPFPLFLLLLPKGAMASPEGNEILYLLVCCHHPDVPKLLNSEHERQISIATMDNGEYTWVHGSGLSDRGIVYANNPLGSDFMDDADMDWNHKLFQVALQATMTISFVPSLIDDATPEGTPFVPSRKKDEKKEGDKLLYPRWIGRNFKRSRSPGTGNHSSPRFHWRSYHWRQQVCGKNRSDRKLIFISTTTVNAEK